MLYMTKCAFVCTFRSWKRPYYKKLKKNCVWHSPKRNFFIKVAFWAQAKNAFKTCNIYGPQEVHKSKRACAFELLPLDWWWITKIPIKIHQFSHTWSLTPLVSSLCSPIARNSSHASHLFSLLCPLRGKSLCSVIRLIFFLFFFLSSTRTDLFFLFFFLNFISI